MDFTYSDFSLNFKPHPFTNDILMKYDVDSVKQALMTLFLTNSYEKLFDPKFGVGINNILFEIITPITKISLLKKIKNQLAFYEPRVVVQELDIVEDLDSNSINIELLFYVVDNPNVVETLTLSFKQLR